MKLKTEWKQSEGCKAVYENKNGMRIHTTGCIVRKITGEVVNLGNVAIGNFENIFNLFGGNKRRTIMYIAEMIEYQDSVMG